MAKGIDSVFPSIQQGQFANEVESGQRQEAHQKHDEHNRKFTPLLVSFGKLPVVLMLPDSMSKVFFLKMVCSLSNNIWRFTRSTWYTHALLR